MSKNQKTALLFLAVSAGLCGYASVKADVTITSFTPGDVVVLRGGDASNPTSAGTITLDTYLDEYTPGGGYVGTIAVPNQSSGSNNALTVSSVAQNHEGILTLSANGNWLTFGGYNTSATTASSGAGVSQVTLGEISQSASTLNTSTLLGPATIRGAVTVDGNEFWSSEGTGAAGLEYTSGTGTTATNTQINATWNGRALLTVANTLLDGSGSSSLGTHGVWQIGSAGTLPTTALTNTSANKTLITDPSTAGAQDGTDFTFANEPDDALSSSLYLGQYNVMYSVGGPNGGASINKYEYNGSSFALVNSVTPAAGASDLLIGITSVVSGSNVDLYYSDNSGLYELVDSDNAASALPTVAVAGSTLDSAPTGELFYGVALAPTAVPEPTTLGLLAVAGIGLLSRRRRMA